MRLAPEEISFNTAGQPVVLVPSLRAAIRLVRKHGTFEALAHGVVHGRLEVMLDLVREGAGNPVLAEHLGYDVQRLGLGRVLAAVQVPMLEFVTGLCAFDPDAKPSSKASKPVSADQFLESLFRTGTGWLGWTPAETLDATPAEIIAAKEGRIELISDVLKAVFGEAEDQVEPETYDADRLAEVDELGFDPAFDRAALNALKAKFKR